MSMPLPKISKPAHKTDCLLFLAFATLLIAGCSVWPKDVKEALRQAGGNHPQLESVLAHYKKQKEAEKLRAAEFLIANMPGHGFVQAGFYTKTGREIAFDALDYPGYAQAQAALNAIEKQAGELIVKRKKFIGDIKNITGEYLIENIDLAFQVRDKRPWAKKMSFETFCRYVLPYRGSEEPPQRWRMAMMTRYIDIEEKPGRPAEANEVARFIFEDISKMIRFNELYYLHPTDQGFDQMLQSGQGRCEDISNLTSYALRACGIACASDYTPAWANRDNNHAWQVVLDENGRGSEVLFNRAAKVYRKTFDFQKNSLAAIKKKNESVPQWLAGGNFVDVTDQYVPVSEVAVVLSRPIPAKSRFVYLCVFNGGKWVAIDWAAIKNGRAVFQKVGRNIVYLPACYSRGELVPVADPFILHPDGSVLALDCEQKEPAIEVSLSAVKPAEADADTQTEKPRIDIQAGKTYELFIWQDGWKSLGQTTACGEPISFRINPGGNLFWLVEKDSDKLERIFTLENGRQIFR